MYSDISNKDDSSGEAGLVKRQESSGSGIKEWLLIATVLDRFFFLVYLILTIALTIIMLNAYPRAEECPFPCMWVGFHANTSTWNWMDWKFHCASSIFIIDISRAKWNPNALDVCWGWRECVWTHHYLVSHRSVLLILWPHPNSIMTSLDNTLWQKFLSMNRPAFRLTRSNFTNTVDMVHANSWCFVKWRLRTLSLVFWVPLQWIYSSGRS